MRFAVALLLLFTVVDASASLPVLVAAVLIALAGALARSVRPVAASVHGGAPLLVRARHRRLPRALDPDAAGRPRPRAPSLHLA